MGLLADGTRVYGLGINGTMAETALPDAGRLVKVPDALSNELAAALPNAIIGVATALKFKAGAIQDKVVLINGTGWPYK